jgi:hypothetical protein
MVLLIEVNLVVVEQDFNKTEVILTVIIINKMIIISLNEEVGEVGIVVIIEVDFVELIEIIHNKHMIQLLIFHHRQIQLNVLRMVHIQIGLVEVVVRLLDNNNKNNGMLVIGMVRH